MFRELGLLRQARIWRPFTAVYLGTQLICDLLVQRNAFFSLHTDIPPERPKQRPDEFRNYYTINKKSRHVLTGLF